MNEYSKDETTCEQPPSKRAKYSYFRYPGDINASTCYSTASLQSAVGKLNYALKLEKQKVHRLQQKLYRKDKSMQAILESLKEKHLLSEHAHNQITKVYYIHQIKIKFFQF